jgi:hypothetical protein
MTVQIPLSQGKVAIVDSVDADLTMCPWCGVSLRPDLERVKPAPMVETKPKSCLQEGLNGHHFDKGKKDPNDPDVCKRCEATWNGKQWSDAGYIMIAAEVAS